MATPEETTQTPVTPAPATTENFETSNKPIQPTTKTKVTLWRRGKPYTIETTEPKTASTLSNLLPKSIRENEKFKSFAQQEKKLLPQIGKALGTSIKFIAKSADVSESVMGPARRQVMSDIRASENRRHDDSYERAMQSNTWGYNTDADDLFTEGMDKHAQRKFEHPDKFQEGAITKEVFERETPYEKYLREQAEKDRLKSEMGVEDLFEKGLKEHETRNDNFLRDYDRRKTKSIRNKLVD